MTRYSYNKATNFWKHIITYSKIIIIFTYYIDKIYLIQNFHISLDFILISYSTDHQSVLYIPRVVFLILNLSSFTPIINILSSSFITDLLSTVIYIWYLHCQFSNNNSIDLFFFIFFYSSRLELKSPVEMQNLLIPCHWKGLDELIIHVVNSCVSQ